MLTLELCWIQVGPCWVHVGAMSSVETASAHVRSKLGLGWPILGLCWGSLNGSMTIESRLAAIFSDGNPAAPSLKKM